MGRDSKLAVVMPSVDGQRFACHSCTLCCRGTVVNLTEEDRRRIDAHDWSGRISRPPYVRIGKEWMLNKTDDGACVFLDEQGLCRIHSRYGPQAKPLACRMFPFGLIPGCDGRRRVSLRFDCPSMARSRGRDITAHADELARLSRQLGRPGRDRAAAPALRRGFAASARHIEAIVERFDGWFGDARRPWSDRIAGAVQATEMLGAVRSDDAAAARIDEHVADAFRAASDAAARARAEATARQRRMLHELVFVHADRTSFEDLRTPPGRRLLQRLRALRCARAFRRGSGKVPRMKGLPANVRFADAEAVRPAEADADRIAELLTRYVRARLQSHTCFGSGFHGWPVLDGLRGLWTAVVVTAWVGRWLAAGEQRSTLTLDDVVRAVGIVDLATLQLPPRRRATTRLRVEYLAGDDGLVRLLDSYPLTPAAER